jgi:hypothetical protein
MGLLVQLIGGNGATGRNAARALSTSARRSNRSWAKRVQSSQTPQLQPIEPPVS